MRVNTSVNLVNNFDDVIKVIKYLQTVPKHRCDRCHNKKKYTRSILPVANLCVNCQKVVQDA